MKKIATLTFIATLFSTFMLQTGCVSSKRDAILKQLDAVSGATKKTALQ